MNREIKVFLPTRIIGALNERATNEKRNRSEVIRSILMKEIDGEVINDGT